MTYQSASWTPELIDRTLREVDTHCFAVEASDLGLRPGEWPERIPTHKGNRQPFIRSTKLVRDGDIVYVRYWQAAGCTSLMVFND